MAHNIEAMEIDNIETEFDNKENSFRQNLLPFASCTEKGYEELDVSELNMKLRYSTTPTSPMSKSLTTYCVDNKLSQSGTLLLNENGNLTHNIMTRSDITGKASKVPPLQLLPTQLCDKNRNTTVLRPLDTTYSDKNIAITISGTQDEDSVSLPSLSSSLAHTPDATTPTKDTPKQGGASPILRGLKSVLNMFRSSQSPIPPSEDKSECETTSSHNISPDTNITGAYESQTASASTPVSIHKIKELNSSKRNSPYKETLVFNDDLEKELEWKDETTIIFSNERYPIHKLYYQKPKKLTSHKNPSQYESIENEIMNKTVEYMDISYSNESATGKTITDIQFEGLDSDNEFVDCESTFTKSESDLLENKATSSNITQQVSNSISNNYEPIIGKSEQQDFDVMNSNITISVQTLPDELVSAITEFPEELNIQQNYEIQDKNHDMQEKVTDKIDSMATNISQNELLEIDSENFKQTQNTIIIKTDRDKVLNDMKEDLTLKSEQTNMGLEKISIINLIQNVNDILVSAVTDMDDDNNKVVLDVSDKRSNVFPQDIVSTDKQEKSKTESNEVIKLEDMVKVNTEKQNDTSSEEVIVLEDSTEKEIRTNSEKVEKSKTGCEMVIKTVSPEYILKGNIEEQSNTKSEEIIKPDYIAQDNTEKESKTNSVEVIKHEDVSKENLELSKTECEMLMIKPNESDEILKENIVKSYEEAKEVIDDKDIIKENKKEETKTESEEVIKLMDMLKINTEEQSDTRGEDVIVVENSTEKEMTTNNVKVVKHDNILKEDLEKSKIGCEMVIKPISAEYILKVNTEEQSNTKSEEIIKPDYIAQDKTEKGGKTNSVKVNKHEDVSKENLELSKTECKPNDSDYILKENIVKSYVEMKEVINLKDIVKENKKEQTKTEIEEVIKLKDMLKINTEEQSNKISEEIIKPEDITKDNTDKERETNSVIKPEDILKENLEKSKAKCEVVIKSKDIFKENSESKKEIKSDDILQENINEGYAETDEIITYETEELIKAVSMNMVKENKKEETKTESEKFIKPKDILKVNTEEHRNIKSEEGIKLEDISLNNTENESNTEFTEDVIKPEDIVKVITEKESQIESEELNKHADIVKENREESKTEAENIIKLEDISKVNAEKQSKEKGEVAIKNKDIEKNTEKESKPESEVVIKSEEILKDKRDKEKDQLSTNEMTCNQLNEDEMILSASNSPFVSFSVEARMVEAPEIHEIFNHYGTECLPTSPPISSKGYNFIFDDINDPFVTKTNIEISPPPALSVTSDTLNRNVNTKNEFSTNRRRSQQERRRTTNIKNKKANKSFDYDTESNYVKDCQLSKQLPESYFKVKERDARDIISVSGETDITVTKLSYIDSSRNKVEATDTALPCGEKPLFSTYPKIHKIDCEDSNLKLPDTTPVFDETPETTLNNPYIGSKTTTFDKTALTIVDEVDPIISKIDTIDTNNVCSEITAKYDSVDNTINQNFIYVSNIESKNEETTEALRGESLPVSKAVANTSISSIQLAYNTEADLEALGSKNVFNLPEINDMNLNSFATERKLLEAEYVEDSKIATTSNTNLNIELQVDENEVANIIKKYNSEENFTNKDVITNEGVESSNNINFNNTTCSSKDSDDKDLTVKEAHTEDEETLEGPFLEAEEILNNDKILNLGTDCDMIRFSDVQPPSKTDNEELFIDAQAFEFLMNQNTNEVADSGKESLFLKFDPLFAGKVNSEGIVAALSDLRKKQSSSSKSSKSACNETFDVSAVAASSTFNANHDVNLTTSEDSNDNNLTVSKPMMAVPPALHPVVTPRNKATTPTRTNRRSITFASPAIAAIDRLLSMSNNSSYVNHEPIVSSQQHEADLALVQLREVLAEKEEQVLYLRIESEELKDKLSNLESQMRTLESESEGRLKKINDLTEKLTDKTKTNRSMAAVVEEYERTIASLIAESEQEKKLHYEEKLRLISERDEQTAHLASMEVSFNDLHSKYEKSKQIILGYKANEETYTKTINEFEENFNKMKNNYEMLKQHATSKLNHANQDLEKMNRAHESEMLKLNAMIKRKDLYITSLEETIAQKSKANEELTAICDELINKVG